MALKSEEVIKCNKSMSFMVEFLTIDRYYDGPLLEWEVL